MNLDHFRKETNSCIVRSKYFTESSNMDDSLSDFKETKKSCTGPKTGVKANSSKPRKAPKRIRGQKDIRKVLKPKKNELETFSKDFDDVCKKSGIDVDSEHLQLAIALSKSLQESSQASEEPRSSKVLTSQERVGKIRTTLLEYGFKVPEIKRAVSTRRLKKAKKEYKLLLTSDIEKEQIIKQRYTHILFNNISHSSDACIDHLNAHLYFLATSASYNIFRDTKTLYVEKLIIEKSLGSGNLLRDWSKIPGRPKSPDPCEDIKINMSDIEFSQEELDVVLSGSLKNTKNICRRKVIFENQKHTNVCDTKSSVNENIRIDSKISLITDSNKFIEEENPKNGVIIDVDEETLSTEYRSCSPDIFDDDTVVVDNSNNVISQESRQLSPEVTQGLVTIIDRNNFMDLTECVQTNKLSSLSQKSQSNMVTIIENNYSMDLTNCVETNNKTSNKLSQNNTNMEITDCIHVNNFNKDNIISVSTTKNNSNDLIEQTKCVGNTFSQSPKMAGNYDLTQSPDNEKSIKILSPDNIDLTGVPQNKVCVEVVNTGDVDLTQSSSTSDELPFISISASEDKINDDTIIVDYDVINVTNKREVNNGEVFDLTQDTTASKITRLSNNEPNRSFFDDYDYNHSDNKDEDVQSNIGDNTVDNECHIDPAININKASGSCSKNSDIDLTQSSNSSNNQDLNEIESKDLDNKDDNISINKENTSVPRCSSLGKKDDISIDYDEFHEDNHESKDNVEHEVNNEYEINNYEDDLAIINDFEVYNYNCSQNSEAFEISDKELDYSINQSNLEKKKDNFDLGGLSVINDLSNINSIRKSVRDSITDLETKNDDILCVDDLSPNTNFNKTPLKHKRINEIISPQRVNTSGVLIETPSNTQFIVRASNVTPMPNYEFMSTPEIHEELDKYGIKPFKRKRAIQLLSHIYNQLHPVVEYVGDEATPSKRFKLNDNKKSPQKRISPRKLLVSPTKHAKNKQSGKPKDKNIKESQGEVIYGMTNEPVLKEVHCDSKDWVFQKREKSKVHSCRVPLHIAFHNYVTSRRGLWEAILSYQPIHIDVIHKDLVGYGHRYDPKDLLKFLDKKCITVKTTDNDGRNQKKVKS